MPCKDCRTMEILYLSRQIKTSMTSLIWIKFLRLIRSYFKSGYTVYIICRKQYIRVKSTCVHIVSCRHTDHQKTNTHSAHGVTFFRSPQNPVTVCSQHDLWMSPLLGPSLQSLELCNHNGTVQTDLRRGRISWKRGITYCVTFYFSQCFNIT